LPLRWSTVTFPGSKNRCIDMCLRAARILLLDFTALQFHCDKMSASSLSMRPKRPLVRGIYAMDGPMTKTGRLFSISMIINDGKEKRQ
jgi:hypothetical protein